MGRVPLSSHRVSDASWAIFGMLMVAMLGVGAAYCVWRAFPTRVEMPVEEAQAAPIFVSAPALPVAPAATYRPPDGRSAPASFVAIHPLSWQDLTLMLRTGLRDDEIIAAAAGTQLVSVIGPAQADTLRELGAGDKLLNFLRNRTVYAPPRATVAIAPLTRQGTVVVTNTARSVPSVSVPAPVDCAARDRKIEALQAQIDALDTRILFLRNHPDSLSLMGTYNGRGGAQGDESPFKKYLDQLDNQRNDLRRQKWQLEDR